MQTVVIAGVGLIGGSFALALRKAGFEGRILGVSSERTLREALSLGIIDEGLPAAEALPRADLVFLSQPICRILEMLGEIDPWLKQGCLVTDAGSTKTAIMSQASKHIHRGLFLGGHPLAGKETRGAAAAEADLFRGRTWVLTPAHPGDIQAAPALEFRGWVEKTGAVPVVMEAAEHDRIVALTSHLPQLLSTALAAMAPETSLAGPALLDLTRLALSPYEVWRDIFATNAVNIGHALEACIEKLETYREIFRGEAMQKEFEAAAAAARQLRGR
jgi:prephenate dehydrogenase